MIDWTRSMKQTYEFYEVDPDSWSLKRKLDNIESATITYDDSSDGLCSATIDLVDYIGEIYIRIFLIVEQDKTTERFSLGTFILQTPNIKFDGKNNKISVDAYSPLLELKEKYIPNGYTILDGTRVMDIAYSLTKENTRAPVISTNSDEQTQSNFVANNDDTYLIFLNDLLRTINYRFDLDDTNKILFTPIQDTKSLSPVWTYTSNNSSILYPDISLERDIYGIPNVVEVLYSKDSGYKFARAENTEEGNPLSIKSRGREIIYRDSNPAFSGIPEDSTIKLYAEQLLRNLSTIECTISYKHGYCPVRVGDGVRLDYEKAGVNGVNAVVKSQKITCEPGCPVEETAVFSSALYG